MSDPCRFSTLSDGSLFVDEFDKFVAFDLGIRLEVSIVDQPRMDFGVGPGTPDGVSSITEVITADGLDGGPCTCGQREYARHQLDQFISLDLGLGLNDVVVDEPGLELRIRPRVVNLVRGIVVIFLHLANQVVAVLLVVRLDQSLGDEPPMLHAS